MTVKLYRQDAYQKEFASTVLETQENSVRLEATAFYPSAGGQAFDTGFLNGIKVLEVKEKDGAIWHRLETPLEVGTAVSGQIDWARRFDHMQQHTGEHLLGQAFFRLSRYVIAVNMEHSVCTLDLGEETTWETAMQAESDVNAAIWAALPIRSYEVPDSEIAQIPLRRTPKVSGMIRVVQIGEYDYSACGGTHTNSSSEVGMLKIFKLERIKGGATRVYFNCGSRLLADYRFKHDFMAGLGLRFSSALEVVPARVDSALEDLNKARLEVANLKTQLAARIAASFLKGVVVYQLEDVTLLPDLAKACTMRDQLVAILGATDGSRAFLAVTCGAGVKQQANELLKIGLPFIEGKGGGKPDLAQGSGSRVAGLEAALEAIRSGMA